MTAATSACGNDKRKGEKDVVFYRLEGKHFIDDEC